jgi:hypothetical protein
MALAVCRDLTEFPHADWVAAAIDQGFGLVMFSEPCTPPRPGNGSVNVEIGDGHISTRAFSNFALLAEVGQRSPPQEESVITIGPRGYVP